MENNKNYEKLLEKELQNLVKSSKKPTLLLHACCGPCFTIPYEIIKGHFDITIIFNNSNIYPKEEHDRRLEEFKRYIREINADVKFVAAPLYLAAEPNKSDYFIIRRWKLHLRHVIV